MTIMTLMMMVEILGRPKKCFKRSGWIQFVLKSPEERTKSCCSSATWFCSLHELSQFLAGSICCNLLGWTNITINLQKWYPKYIWVYPLGEPLLQQYTGPMGGPCHIRNKAEFAGLWGVHTMYYIGAPQWGEEAILNGLIVIVNLNAFFRLRARIFCV